MFQGCEKLRISGGPENTGVNGSEIESYDNDCMAATIIKFKHKV